MILGLKITLCLLAFLRVLRIFTLPDTLVGKVFDIVSAGWYVALAWFVLHNLH